jgi:nicotinamide-nucleotide amidase
MHSPKERSVFDPETLDLAASVLALCRARRWHVATAESCTGGLVAAALTAIAGSSGVFDRGFVTLFERSQDGSARRCLRRAARGGVSSETALVSRP